jgi:two-component system alkaline phosphatase synthesis response regulator PhoP
MDGFEVFKKIRETPGFEKLPVIFLTAKAGEANEILGLEIGASDYIQKPISPKKLVARVKSNLKKFESASVGKTAPLKITLGPLLIDKDKYVVYLAGKEKFFPRKEFELLYYLANNPGKVFSRDMLLKDVWGTDVYVVDRTVDVHIRKIREKLDQYSDLIETVKGVGYKFKSVE